MKARCAGIMPLDATDPDSLVGRMLGVGSQEISGDGSGEALPPVSNEPRVCEPMALWEAMHIADLDAPYNYRQAIAAEIEAVRDYIAPEEPPLQPDSDTWVQLAYGQRQRLRDLLTEQARIARGEA